MSSNRKDKANRERVVKMNEQVRMDVYLKSSERGYSEKWEKAKERFRRPAYYGCE